MLRRYAVALLLSFGLLSTSVLAKGNGSVTVHITRTGAKYHSAGCRYLSRSDIPISLADAVAQGFTPCSVCDPPTLSGASEASDSGGNYDWHPELAEPLPPPPPPPADIKGYQLSGSTWLLGQSIADLHLDRFTQRAVDGWDIYEYIGRDLQFNERPARGNVRLYARRGKLQGIELDVALTERGWDNFRDYYAAKLHGLDSDNSHSDIVAWADNDGDTLSVTDEGADGTVILYTASGITLPDLEPLLGENANYPTCESATPVETSRVSPFVAPPAGSEVFTVERVVDGDTIAISDGGVEQTVRLIGVDTPETVDPRKPVQAFGKEASSFLHNLLTDESVCLTYDQERQDRYGRTLAYVWRYPDGLFVNAEIVRQGYGHAYLKYPFEYADQFSDYESKARIYSRGLWNAEDQPDGAWLDLDGDGMLEWVPNQQEAEAEPEQQVNEVGPEHSDYSPSTTPYVRPDDGEPKTVHVRGYYRKDGTYVHPYNRRAPRRRK